MITPNSSITRRVPADSPRSPCHYAPARPRRQVGAKVTGVLGQERRDQKPRGHDAALQPPDQTPGHDEGDRQSSPQESAADTLGWPAARVAAVTRSSGARVIR